MAIVIELDVILAKRKMKLNDLAAAVGITPQNLSVLKSGRAKAVRFSTLDAICQHLQCEPGDILVYQPKPPKLGDLDEKTE
jgi:putative transcriptional regulator